MTHTLISAESRSMETPPPTVPESILAPDRIRRPLRVLKFGGSSVATASSIRAAVDITVQTARHCHTVVVVSALSGVTDSLEGCIKIPHPDGYEILSALFHRHVSTAGKLLSAPAAGAYRKKVLQTLLQIIPALRRVEGDLASQSDYELILAVGERLSAPLFAFALREHGLDSIYKDSTELIRVESINGAHHVLPTVTREHVTRWFEQLLENTVPVVTGFIGGTADGRTVTLGRGGSDYVASLVAASLRADLLERWTDVDGLYDTDPNRIKTATLFDILPMEGVAVEHLPERFGMHRHTLAPLLANRIPMRVRSLTTRHPGTLLLPDGMSAESIPVFVQVLRSSA